ncbi:dendritic cell-specific transmembrane protein [Dendropsophus ebraccatus]|uniref:dendritic cell-specific transmembrane protein n=1 Tax=Dendropsophus ebraccatus TaxID=150705 RepID=UPI003832109A
MAIRDVCQSMMVVPTKILQFLSYCMNLFVLGREAKGWKNILVFAFLCLLFGMSIGGSLVLVFHLSKVGLRLETLAVALSIGLLISILSFIFKAVRCNGLLFLLCCGMKEGRNVLIAVGTSIVVFNNVKNIFGNLKILSTCVICNLQKKRDMLRISPFDYYIQTLRDLYQKAKELFFNPVKDIVKVEDTFYCSVTIEDGPLKDKLLEATQQIQDQATKIVDLLNTVVFFGRIAFLLLGVSLIVLGSAMFFRKFLATDNVKFENIFITKKFKEYDQSRKQQNMLCVLPLNKAERKVYMTIPSLKTSRKQMPKLLFFLIPVLTNVFIWCLITALDYILYWVILTINKNLQGLRPIKVPMSMTLSEWSKKKIHGTEMIFNLFEPECTPEPELMLTDTWIPLSAIIGVLLFLCLISAFLIQIKSLLISTFYPEKEHERILYLHNKILEDRVQLASQYKGGKLKKIICQVNFWFPIITRKHITTQ